MKSNDPHSAPNWNALWARLVVEELVRSGVDTFCISPGSRSTPLVVAAARHPRARTKVHIDERGAAFFALGRARATGRPAAWITTSGTAAANGLPAVIEAAQDGVPLLCLTADRPPELRDSGANQAIDQVGLFGRYPRWQVDLPPPSGLIHPGFLLTSVDQAVHRATGANPGPVHLNMMFREPLAPDGAGIALQTELHAWFDGSHPYTGYAPATIECDTTELTRALSTVKNGIVVAGRCSAASGAAAARLAESRNWPLFADICSGQRLGPGSEARIRHYDLLLASSLRSERPEAVVQIGSAPVSKTLMLWLAAARPPVYAAIAPSPVRIDPQHHVTHRLTGDPVVACAALQGASAGRQWLDTWRAADRKAADAVQVHLEGPLSEPAVAARVAAHLPEGHGLFLSNSMPIRDMDRFAGDGIGSQRVGANRGASGIDGVVSSAAGFSDGLGAPVTLVIGDLALFHDLNGLAWLRGHRVVVVVINNDGGGIFSFLPIAAHHDVFEEHFATPHGRTFRAAADLFDLAYEAPDDLVAFDASYRRSLAREGSTIIEVRTDRAQNPANHREIVAAVGRPLDA